MKSFIKLRSFVVVLLPKLADTSQGGEGTRSRFLLNRIFDAFKNRAGQNKHIFFGHVFTSRTMVSLAFLVTAGAGAQTLQWRETALQPESCYDRISKGREAFFDAARVSNNANTVDDLLSLYRQTSQPGTIRIICTNKRAADMFEVKVALANYIAKVGDAR